MHKASRVSRTGRILGDVRQFSILHRVVSNLSETASLPPRGKGKVCVHSTNRRPPLTDYIGYVVVRDSTRKIKQRSIFPSHIRFAFCFFTKSEQTKARFD